MQLKRNDIYKNSFFYLVADMRTQWENTEIIIFFIIIIFLIFFFGGGGGGHL